MDCIIVTSTVLHTMCGLPGSGMDPGPMRQAVVLAEQSGQEPGGG